MSDMADKIKTATVGIAGLGGLGSAVAWSLARTGVGRLIIADFDSVEYDNLSRQQYFIEQVGENKVDATIRNLQHINRDLRVEGHHLKLNANNIPTIFAEADVIAECFDKAQEKQMIVETVLGKMDRAIVVTASGLAGYGRSNAIKTRRITNRLILVGDNQSGVDPDQPLTAGRVGIAAGHQANMIIEIIADEIYKS